MKKEALVFSPVSAELSLLSDGDRYVLRCRSCGATVEAPKRGHQEITLFHESGCAVLLAVSQTERAS